MSASLLVTVASHRTPKSIVWRSHRRFKGKCWASVDIVVSFISGLFAKPAGLSALHAQVAAHCVFSVLFSVSVCFSRFIEN